jgi:hypothetical protein
LTLLCDPSSFVGQIDCSFTTANAVSFYRTRVARKGEGLLKRPLVVLNSIDLLMLFVILVRGSKSKISIIIIIIIIISIIILENNNNIIIVTD